MHKHNLETAWIPDFFCSNYNVKKVVMVLIWDLFLDQISSYLSLLGNLPSTPLAAPSKMVTATMALNEHIWAVQWQLLAKGPPCHLKNQLQARTERYSPSNTWEFTILTLNILLHLPTKTTQNQYWDGEVGMEKRQASAGFKTTKRGNPAPSFHSFTYSTKSCFCTHTEASENNFHWNSKYILHTLFF